MKFSLMQSHERLLSTFILPLVFFFLGVFSVIAQAVIIREFLVVVYGSEPVMGLLFFDWLFGIFLGALAGGYISGKSRDPAGWFVSAIITMGLTLPLCITAVRSLYLLSGTPAGTYTGFFQVLLFSALSVIPLGFFTGAAFPLAAATAAAAAGDTGPGQTISVAAVQQLDRGGDNLRRVSLIYISEALGFLAGGLLYTFCLVGRANPFFIAGLAALPVVLPAAAVPGLTLKGSRKGSKKYFKTGAAALLTAASLLVFVVSPLHRVLDGLTENIRWRGFSSIPRLYSTDSKYQHIAVARLYDQYSLYLNTGFAAVFPETEDNRVLAAHLLCQHRAAKRVRVLIIGDALAGLGKQLLAYNLDNVTALEIDPLVTETMLKFLPAEDKAIRADPRFSLLTVDGRSFVKNPARWTGSASSAAFDIVYLNVPEPATLLANRYYTLEFFRDLAGILRQDGVVALRITSSENYAAGLVSEYTASIYHTLAAVFPEIAVTPGTSNYLFASRQKGVVSSDPEILAGRFKKTGVKPEALGLIFYSLYPAEKTKYITGMLRGEGMHANHGTRSQTRKTTGDQLNRDEIPAAVFEFNKILGWYSGSDLAGILGFFQRVKPVYFLLLLLPFFLAAVWSSTRRRRRGNASTLDLPVPTPVFAALMAGLTLELVILYLFQVVFGYMYHMLGFIIALFMCGLPAGAIISTVILERCKLYQVNTPKHRQDDAIDVDKRVLVLIAAVLAGLALLSLLLSRARPLLAAAGTGQPYLYQSVIFLFTMSSGFATGMIFPLALHAALQGQKQPGRATGILSAADHLGGAAGALVLGTLLLPVLGIAAVCLLVAVLLILAALLPLLVLAGHSPKRRKKSEN